MTNYDPSLGFVYMIDGRGQGCLQDIDASLVADLADRAAGCAPHLPAPWLHSPTASCSAQAAWGPAEHTAPACAPTRSKAMRTEINLYKPDGSTASMGLDTAYIMYWIARYEFMAVLFNAVGAAPCPPTPAAASPTSACLGPSAHLSPVGRRCCACLATPSAWSPPRAAQPSHRRCGTHLPACCINPGGEAAKTGRAQEGVEQCQHSWGRSVGGASDECQPKGGMATGPLAAWA